eukprot:338367-Lingulodinium_polyedra.AAC.1
MPKPGATEVAAQEEPDSDDEGPPPLISDDGDDDEVAPGNESRAPLTPTDGALQARPRTEEPET